MSRVSQVSKRYAKALFSVVNNKELSLSELKTLESIFCEPVNMDFLSSHFVSDANKKLVIHSALSGKGISENIINFVLILVENRRAEHFKDIIISFENLLDSEKGIIRGTVRSATSLDSATRLEMEKAISAFVKKDVVLTYSEELNLIGGTVAHVSGWTFEDTLDSHLRRLKEELNRRAN